MFDPTTYPPAVADLVSRCGPTPLGPGTPDRTAEAALARLGDADFGRPSAACRAGLWLAFNFLDESHRISQDLATPEGSFWHAVMHRREPDAWNSKYWWRKVGPHPVLKQLTVQAPTLGYTYTNPLDFVDFCETVRGTGTPAEDLARRVQLLEWQLLFDWCYRLAAG